MKKNIVFVFLLFVTGVVSANDSCKVLLTQSALNLEGGYKIPKVSFLNKNYVTRALDKLPGTNRWVGTHRGTPLKGGVIEFTDPGSIGTSENPDLWPQLAPVKVVPALNDIDKIDPWSVYFLDSDHVYTSSRKGYRSGFEPKWISKVQLSTGNETVFEVRRVSDTDPDSNVLNFEFLQAFGAGFVRINDQAWSNTYIGGRKFLLGRGGYDVLGSPLGPSFAAWDEGDSFISINDVVLWYQLEHPLKRDSDYYYPDGSLDPNTSIENATLNIWKTPDQNGGYWQGGQVGGNAQIFHPYIKGFVSTHNFARGILDYRAQGDAGTGYHFNVADTQLFYTTDGSGDRGGHSQEPLNSGYPNGELAWGAHVFDPSVIGNAALGNIEKWDPESIRFDWPWQTFPAINYNDSFELYNSYRRTTQFGSIFWDNELQRLWVVAYIEGGNERPGYVLQYSLLDTRPKLVSGITVAISN